MINRWLNIPAKYRRGVAYSLVVIGTLATVYLVVLGFYGLADAVTRGPVEQADGQAQWAVEASQARVVEK